MSTTGAFREAAQSRELLFRRQLSFYCEIFRTFPVSFHKLLRFLLQEAEYSARV